MDSLVMLVDKDWFQIQYKTLCKMFLIQIQGKLHLI